MSPDRKPAWRDPNPRSFVYGVLFPVFFVLMGLFCVYLVVQYRDTMDYRLPTTIVGAILLVIGILLFLRVRYVLELVKLGIGAGMVFSGGAMLVKTVTDTMGVTQPEGGEMTRLDMRCTVSIGVLLMAFGGLIITVAVNELRN